MQQVQLIFGGQSFSFDANGNLASDDATTYTWDARNRLLAVSGPVPAGFQYDPLGRRTTRAIGITTTRFQYDGVNPILDAADGGQTTTLLTGLGIDEYLTRTDSGGLRGFLVDTLGSTLALTDAGGTPVTSYSYEPFGRTETTGALSSNAFHYTGRENDGSGLYYYRARYYAPQFSRFSSEDPLRFCGVGVAPVRTRLREASAHPYTYVDDNPATFIDPFGLDKTPDCIGPLCKCKEPPGGRVAGSTFCIACDPTKLNSCLPGLMTGSVECVNCIRGWVQSGGRFFPPSCSTCVEKLPSAGLCVSQACETYSVRTYVRESTSGLCECRGIRPSF